MAEARAAAVVGTYGQLRSKTLARSDMRVEELSPYVRDVGVTSFGSIAAFEAILNQTRMQRLVTLDGALTRTLASHKGGVCLEQRVSGISWSALTLEAGKSPTEVTCGRHVPRSPPSAISEFASPSSPS